ncbi:MAG: hypothetical protein V4850_23410 [Myxococcota bacterium]
MPLWLVALSYGAEPIVVGSVPDTTIDVAVSVEVVVPWSEAGLVPARAESPPIGPDLLAMGPDGEVAFYDPVHASVVIVGMGSFPVAGVDDLLFTPSGTLLVLSGGFLSAYDASGVLVERRALPGMVPPGGALGLDGSVVCSLDLFGGCHTIAIMTGGGGLASYDGPSLRPPTRVVRRVGDALFVNDRRIATLAGRGGGRLLGDWLLVEEMDDGTVSRRAVSLRDGAEVALPVEGRLYAPSRDVACAPDGTLGWIDPRADGLHIAQVTP